MSSQRLLPVFTAALLILCAAAARAVPPFNGTIFLDPDIIKPTDPTAFLSAVDAGRGMRTMYDRRVNNWVNLNAYLINATFDDGLKFEVQVNPEFGSAAAAGVEARKYAEVIGRLPTGLRTGVATVWIHKGTQPFGGGNKNLLIHIGQADQYVASGILEETFVHEAAHSTLDPLHASAPGWIAAQQADPDFISTYARDNPTREDIAESYLPYLAVRHRKDRISASLASTISKTMPNRMAYFDSLGLSLYPIVPMQLSLERTGLGTLKLSWPAQSTAWKLQQNTAPTGGAWTTPPELLTTEGGRRFITIQRASDQRYFRLMK